MYLISSMQKIIINIIFIIVIIKVNNLIDDIYTIDWFFIFF